MGAKLLVDSLKVIEANKYELILQDENKVSLAPKLTKDDGLIDWASPAEEIRNLIKG